MPDGFHFISPDDVPDEVRQQIEQAMDRQQMGLQTVAHDVQRLFRELDADQLSTLRFLMHTVAHNSEAGFYYEGVLATLYSMKANVCPACGEDHDKQIAESMHPSTEGPSLGATVTSEEISAQAEQYGVAFLESSPTGKVRCRGCGTEYVSLADRMIQEPGPAGCSGCQQKAKWG